VLEHFVDAGHGARCGIVVCQPRRVAAVSIARRVAEERGEKVGDVVGYRVRGESRTSNRPDSLFVPPASYCNGCSGIQRWRISRTCSWTRRTKGRRTRTFYSYTCGVCSDRVSRSYG
jgi:hypothetical protein